MIFAFHQASTTLTPSTISIAQDIPERGLAALAGLVIIRVIYRVPVSIRSISVVSSKRRRHEAELPISDPFLLEVQLRGEQYSQASGLPD